ncbi:WD40 repeat-like protein [Mycena sanguinolenta]|uniref:WD40 repeat-like protein n=1 Tax=Mycena sanguinolenta TaxID=230812 RepID=A0A8H6YTA3_9AGAR|nr:WD40 repeat-like protein [Mycena sanguinolenta]
MSETEDTTNTVPETTEVRNVAIEETVNTSGRNTNAGGERGGRDEKSAGGERGGRDEKGAGGGAKPGGDQPARRIRACNGKCGSRESRNLVISIDGTSNQFGEYNTNVVELHSRVLVDASANQHKYYNCGIGTYVPPDSKASVKYWLQRADNIIDLAIAWNFKSIILKAYRWLSQEYKPGDKIFIFGFSRGAYQVGLVHAGNEEMIPFAYEIFSERHKGRGKLLISMLRHCFKSLTMSPKGLQAQKRKNSLSASRKHFPEMSGSILLGCGQFFPHFSGFAYSVARRDTVSSVGLARGKPLPLTWTAEHICIFRHALALDERRVKFLPEYVTGGSSARSSVISANKVPDSESVAPAQAFVEDTPASGSPAQSLASVTPTQASVKGVPVPEGQQFSSNFWDVKEVWFPGSHSDIGGGNMPNIELNLSSVPLLWMENEATSAGLRLKPRADGGRWKTSDLKQCSTHESLKGFFWRLVEHLPLKRLTYQNHEELTRTPHRGAGRIIVPGQRIHVSIAFKTASYTPRATFLSDSNVEWTKLIGQGLNLTWAQHLNAVELDLFDASFMIEAIQKLRDLWIKKRTGDEEKALESWIERLKFMAVSGQLAANYLSELEQSSAQTYEKRLNDGLELFQNALYKKHPQTFAADIAVLLEQKAGWSNQVDVALDFYKQAQQIRLEIAQWNKASRPGIEILQICLDRLSKPHDMLNLPKDLLVIMQGAARLRQNSAPRDPNQPLADSLQYIGQLLRRLGQEEDALRADTEVVALRRKLAETDPGLTNDLAQSLHNLGIDFNAAGCPEDAVRTGEEAVKLRRQLAETDPGVTRELGWSLVNLGTYLEAAGRLEDAVYTTEEAVKLCYQLTETDPGISSILAGSLYNLGIYLNDAGRPEDAVHAAEEAVKLCYQLTETNPDISGVLAWSLLNLGNYLRAAGRPEDAVRTDEEAVKLHRQLAETNPDITRDLAWSLHNLGIHLSAAGRPEDAVHASEEAVKLRRQLAETDPGITGDLAWTLHNLGIYLSAASHPEDAVRVSEEAVKLRRQLAETDPGITRDLAWSLHNLGIYLKAAGRPQDAVRAAKQAAKLRRQLAGTDRGADQSQGSSARSTDVGSTADSDSESIPAAVQLE